ncbi:3-deoxy-D-manno-octulosonic acid transferase [Desulfopila sp. IMCC35008]|uniref:3-deoxy-D-manno-octulosonic acid transferase n=1 Tax=Desulfopila sp. IMCC35008 TaxID=2653858 RepID=UPI0013D490C6|nr:glycosyltransferase N-terminal domain-containing protein [Desulfopila sp. IMCC35008]
MMSLTLTKYQSGLPERKLYIVYQLLLILLLYPALVLLLVYVLITGNHREGIRQRFSLYKRVVGKKSGKRVWFHAASVGEVQAASLLIDELRRVDDSIDIILTTMTIHGRIFAESQLDDVTCLLAPLDLPGMVGRAVRLLDPDVYVCLETELWPLLLRKLHKQEIPVLMVNGRMSLRSVQTYHKYSWFFKTVLANFSRLCLISETDRERFLGAGVAAESIEVTGNIKFDRYLPDNVNELQDRYRRLLAVSREEEVFVAGSTHDDEEEQLLTVFRALKKRNNIIWLLAPRHLQRVSSILEMFRRNDCGVDLFSDLQGGKKRQYPIVLIDTFGDLSKMYSIATYVFCGGSLVDKRGHNILEPALWGKPVFYGPSMDDFRDGVELLEKAGCGYTVYNTTDLVEKIEHFRDNQGDYHQVCRQAEKTAGSQQGAAARQAEVVLSFLSGGQEDN